jgi:type I restriction enzyme S subunit
MLCDTVYRFRANESLVLPAYLEIALNAPRVIADIDSRKSGISDSGISLNHRTIKQVSIPLPMNMAEQREIVERTEAVLSSVDNLECEIGRQIDRAATLKQAILATAFSGRLVEQDSADEPASLLLQRIPSENGLAAQEQGARRTTRRKRKDK